MNYIDAHAHVWTDDVLHYPFLGDVLPDAVKPRRFLPEDILSHAAPCGVNRIVLVQMSYYGFDNSYMLDTMQRFPDTFSGIAVIDPHSADPGEAMKHLARRGVRGFRITPRLSPVKDWLVSDGYTRMFETGAAYRLAVCPLIDPDSLEVLDRVCTRYPDTPVIIDHLCRIGSDGTVRDEDIRGLCSMALHPHAFVKVSAFYALGRKRPPYDDLSNLIEKVYQAFGPERLMWASDCPYQVQDIHTYTAGIDLIKNGLPFLSDKDREQILCKTAENFFFSGRNV